MEEWKWVREKWGSRKSGESKTQEERGKEEDCEKSGKCRERTEKER